MDILDRRGLRRYAGRARGRTVSSSRVGRAHFVAFASALLVVWFGGVAGLQVQEKGGEDETGPYEVVAGWPQPWAQTGYIWGSQPGVFAESPNRMFLAVRG